MAACAPKTRLRKRPEEACVSDVDSGPPPKKANASESALVPNVEKKSPNPSGTRRQSDHPRGSSAAAVDEAPVYVHRILGSRRGYDKTRPPPAHSFESEGRQRGEEIRRSARIGDALALSTPGNSDHAGSSEETTAPSSHRSSRLASAVDLSVDSSDSKRPEAQGLSGRDSDGEGRETACSRCVNHKPPERASAASPQFGTSALSPGASSATSAPLDWKVSDGDSLRHALQPDAAISNVERSPELSAGALSLSESGETYSSSSSADLVSGSSGGPHLRGRALPSSSEPPALPSWLKQLNSPMLPSMLPASSADPQSGPEHRRLKSPEDDEGDGLSVVEKEASGEASESMKTCHRARATPLGPPPAFPLPLSVPPGGARGRPSSTVSSGTKGKAATVTANGGGASPSERGEKAKNSPASDSPGRTTPPAPAWLSRTRPGPATGATAEKVERAGRTRSGDFSREASASCASSQTLKRFGEGGSPGVSSGGRTPAATAGTAASIPQLMAPSGSPSRATPPGSQPSGQLRNHALPGSSEDDTSPIRANATGASPPDSLSLSPSRSSPLPPPLPRALPRRAGPLGVCGLSAQRGGIGIPLALSEHPSFSLEKQLQGAEDRRAFLRRLLRGGAPGRPEWPLPVETKTLLEAAGVTAGRFQPDRWFCWGIEPFPSARVLEWKLARVLGRPVLDAAARGDATVWGILCLSLGAIVLGADVAELRAGFQRQGLPVPDPLQEGRSQFLRGTDAGK
ncbi:hypothetical protein TGFOU_225230 [Toxoplasma gondii FOU]|uniref:Uncharacterized protein n=3 Tax=Toxoplasma gondii TaxID=5811 RepID=A0A086LEL6_TOXGO|nr:hypothetical protein TGFOU_225230 [Toxoplasma gondii FOU]PUA91255.1 hypothetical protein TGBR9_225230 [Toxoplasma gondii TgCATBr9]RQX74614.1 hypothetical protein TGCAST_225230 [Toxoplasma gondii CAST]